MEQRFLNIEQAAEYLGFSVHTLYGWTSQRRIPFVKIGGRVRFDKQKLDKWIEQFELEAAANPESLRRRAR
ncbi:MAG: helix-turn-helix domain-containing protein [Rhodothermia bacterium]|nr:helix-turn-helix domain-containing protein [Rhodothermia bacterium]